MRLPHLCRRRSRWLAVRVLAGGAGLWNGRGDRECEVYALLWLSLLFLPEVSHLPPVPGSIGRCLAVHQGPFRQTGGGLWGRGLFPPFLFLPLSFPLLLLLLQLSKNSEVRAWKVPGTGES